MHASSALESFLLLTYLMVLFNLLLFGSLNMGRLLSHQQHTLMHVCTQRFLNCFPLSRCCLPMPLKFDKTTASHTTFPETALSLFRFPPALFLLFSNAKSVITCSSHGFQKQLQHSFRCKHTTFLLHCPTRKLWHRNEMSVAPIQYSIKNFSSILASRVQFFLMRALWTFLSSSINLSPPSSPHLLLLCLLLFFISPTKKSYRPVPRLMMIYGGDIKGLIAKTAKILRNAFFNTDLPQSNDLKSARVKLPS